MGLVALDQLDRLVVHALQIDGRAAFSKIATVLGVSDQTVARRYRRLRESGAVRVVGLPNVGRFGSTACLIRVQCTPNMANQIADALAHREDTSWVNLVAGGTEIVCLTRTTLGSERAPLLLHELPRSPRVVGISAQYILHMFSGGPSGWYGKANALTDKQIQALTPTYVTDSPEEELVPIRDGDSRLIAALAKDGRAKTATLSAATGLTEASVQRRLDQLTLTRALFFDVEIDPITLGYNTAVMLWISVAPSKLVPVGERMSGHREIALAAAITGTTNLLAIAVCRNIEHFYSYLTGRIGMLEGIRHVETAPVIRSIKRAGSLTVHRS